MHKPLLSGVEPSILWCSICIVGCQRVRKTLKLYFLGRKLIFGKFLNLCLTWLIIQFQKHTVSGAERKPGPELQSSNPSVKRKVKGDNVNLNFFH